MFGNFLPQIWLSEGMQRRRGSNNSAVTIFALWPIFNIVYKIYAKRNISVLKTQLDQTFAIFYWKVCSFLKAELSQNSWSKKYETTESEYWYNTHKRYIHIRVNVNTYYNFYTFIHRNLTNFLFCVWPKYTFKHLRNYKGI